jgi:hypothetical protein
MAAGSDLRAGAARTRAAILVAALLTALIAAGPAAPATRLSPADRQAIGTTLDRFVKDVVLRRDLRAGWELAGPDLQGGTTRAAWISGKGVTVAAYPARGSSFKNAWTGRLVGPGHLEGSMVLQPKAGSRGYDQTAVTLDLRRIAGRWVVDIFYPAAVFRTGTGKRGSCGQPSCAISGPADYGPQGAASAAGNTSARVSGHTFLLVLGGIGIAVLLTPLAIWARIKRRDSRVRAAYEAHNNAVR